MNIIGAGLSTIYYQVCIRPIKILIGREKPSALKMGLSIGALLVLFIPLSLTVLPLSTLFTLGQNFYFFRSKWLSKIKEASLSETTDDKSASPSTDLLKKKSSLLFSEQPTESLQPALEKYSLQLIAADLKVMPFTGEKIAVAYGANCHLTTGGGTAGAVFKRFNFNELELSQRSVKQDMKLHHGDVVAQNAEDKTSNTQIYLLHALAPSLSESNHKGSTDISLAAKNPAGKSREEKIQTLMIETYVNVLKECNKKAVTHLYLPLLGEGFFQISLDNTVEALFQAMTQVSLITPLTIVLIHYKANSAGEELAPDHKLIKCVAEKSQPYPQVKITFNLPKLGNFP